MEIKLSRKMKKICDSARRMDAELGELAKPLRRRLAELEAAESLDELRRIANGFHILTGNLKGYFALRLSANYRLICRPADNPIPQRPDGSWDLCAIKAVVVECVKDYH